MQRYRFLLFPIAFTIVIPSSAALAASNPGNTIVISPTRWPAQRSEIGSSVSVITEEDITRSQATSVTELLRDVPGVTVTRSGGPGQTARIFIRGAETNHTLVRIDGVEVNDPSSPDTAYDFATLTPDNIARIEVLRGPQGTLYGSEAIGGVINITTKKGEGTPTHAAQAEGGSYATSRVALSASGSAGAWDYSAQLSRFNTDGISAIGKKHGGSERDGEETKHFSGRLGAQWNERLSTFATLRYTDSKVEYDEFFPLSDAPFFSISDEAVFRGGANLSLWDGRWQQEFGASYLTIDRKNEDSFPRTTEGERVAFDWMHQVTLTDRQKITLGLETKEDRYTAHDSFTAGKASVRNNAIFAQDALKFGDNFFTTIGARVDDHETFGTETTYRIAPTYRIAATGTQIKASYGTGFKAPALYELYDPFFGNADLEPERSRGWDAGVEQALLGNRLNLGVTWFHNDIRDLIGSDPATFAAINVGEAKTQGLETTVSWDAAMNLIFTGNYTYTLAEDKETGLELIRRPKHKAALGMDYTFLEKGRAGATLSYVGARQDSRFPGRVRLPSYLVTDITASWQWDDRVTLYGRGDNLFNESYEEIYGFSTPGLSVYGGVKVTY